METKFNFNSAICTSRSQSERLLALGLKRETADMIWTHAYYSTWAATARENPLYFHEADEDTIPAWSLHRIMSMVYSSRVKKNGLGLAIIEYDNPFEDMIRQIEWLIKEGHFPKEYLN